MSKEKLLDRIKKLLALAGNNPNKNEAEIAMRRATKLLRDNDLSMESVTEVENEVIGEQQEKNVQKWTRIIYKGVSDLYHCDYFIGHERHLERHTIVGTESNRVTTAMICKYLIKSINKESRKYPKYQQTAFKNGAALGVYSTCKKLIEEENASKEEVIIGTGLVPMDIRLMRLDAAKAYVNANHSNLYSMKSRSMGITQDGKQYGSSLSVRPHLSGEGQRALN